MAVGTAVTTATDVNPEVFAVGGLKDELVEVGVAFQPVEPAMGGLQVGMATVVVPGGVGGEGQTEVGGFAQGVLGGVGSTNTDVELIASVAGRDDNGAANEGAERFEYLLAELLQDWDVLCGDGVIDTQFSCLRRPFKL